MRSAHPRAEGQRRRPHQVGAPVRDALVASKKQGIVNGVEATPTFFINGRRVTADPDLQNVIELADEEHERLGAAKARAGC